jgi:hypothetical protein
MTRSWIEPAKELLFIVGLFALVMVAVANATPDLNTLGINYNYGDSVRVPASVRALEQESVPVVLR